MELFASLQSDGIEHRASDIAFARLTCRSISLQDLQADTDFLPRQSLVDHVNRRDYEGDWNAVPAREHGGAHLIPRVCDRGGR